MTPAFRRTWVHRPLTSPEVEVPMRAVDRGRTRSSDLPGQSPDRSRRQAGVPATASAAGTGARQFAQLFDRVESSIQGAGGPEVDQVLGEQNVDDPGQQQHVGARADRQVLVGRGGRAGAHGVDDDQPPTPCPQRSQTARACPAPSSSTRSRPTGCRRSQRTDPCGRCPAPARTTRCRTSAPAPPAAASGRQCWPRTGTASPAHAQEPAGRTCWSRCARSGLPR